MTLAITAVADEARWCRIACGVSDGAESDGISVAAIIAEAEQALQSTESVDVAGEAGMDFRYLNGGAWIGRTEFVRSFFADACAMPPLAEMPAAEQGILKQLFPRHYPRVQLDYRCTIIQNIGFVLAPILEIVP